MKRFALSIAFAAAALASLQLFNPAKAFADTDGNCQATGAACNTGATLNCCSGNYCGISKGVVTTGPGYCYVR